MISVQVNDARVTVAQHGPDLQFDVQVSGYVIQIPPINPEKILKDLETALHIFNSRDEAY